MDQLVPVTNAPNQHFEIPLSIDGTIKTLELYFRYSEICGYWVVTVYDANGNLLLDSIPLLTGQWPGANVLKQFGYLGIGSLYVINVSGIAKDFPDSTNLGTDFQLVWSDTHLNGY